MEIFAITGKPLSVCESKKYMQIGRTRHVRACFTDNRITPVSYTHLTGSDRLADVRRTAWGRLLSLPEEASKAACRPDRADTRAICTPFGAFAVIFYDNRNGIGCQTVQDWV